MGRKVSIIIPVYNTQEFLYECIDSACSQTYQNIELVIVDDGSTDNSGQMCDEYAERDDRIRIIHTQNGGLARARNIGIRLSTGEYILFLDSDDYYTSENAIEELVKQAELTKSDVVCFNYTRNGNSCAIKAKMKNEDNIEKIIEHSVFTSSACIKLLRKSLLIENNIYFVEGQMSEDILFCGKILMINNIKIYFLNEKFYYYRIRTGSITRTIGQKNIEDVFEVVVEMSKSINENVLSYTAFQYATLLINIHLTDKPLPNEITEKIYKLKYILSFDKINIVKLINIVQRMVGVKITSKLLHIYYANKG